LPIRLSLHDALPIFSRKGETVPVVVTLTRAIIRVQSVKSKTIEPGYVWVRVSQFQEATAENLVKQLDALFRSGQVKGLVLDLRKDRKSTRLNSSHRT